jgi:ribosomal protein S18 acetylase RimI-like enzyme
VSRDAAAWERMLESMRVFFSSVPPSSSGGRVVELDGVIAGVTPVVPERSLPNSVVYRDEQDLIRALDDLAALYDDAGVLAWTVWTPEYHEHARQALADSGHVLDANPEAMIAELAEVEAPRESDPDPDPEPMAEDLGVINDLAYSSGDAFQRLLGSGRLDPAHTWIAHFEGKPAASVVTQDHNGDCSVWWVATVPEARGRGLAPGLMRRALAAGRERGCEVTTLQATKAGQPVYERLGYRALGAIEMWECRRAEP